LPRPACFQEQVPAALGAALSCGVGFGGRVLHARGPVIAGRRPALMTLHSIFRLAVVAGFATCGALAQAATTTVPGGRYGDVTVTQPSGPLRGFVVLYSQASGWNAADQQTADALAKAGALTVGVDTARYAARLSGEKESCHQLVGDAEALSHQLERQAHSSHYFAP